MRSEVLPQLGGLAIGFGGLLVGLACGGTAHQSSIAPPPARQTRAVLAGGLCQDNRCSCRGDTGDGGVGVPDTAERKRYEIRLGPTPFELWLTVDGSTVLYKSPERAQECFYIDLPTGAHQVELRASNPEGVKVGLRIHELGTRTRSWYDTFAFTCGSQGPCSFDELETNKAEYAAAQRHMYDRCGTTKVKAVSWDHGKAPDQIHPSELVVRLTLDIYKFAAWKQHGDTTCGEGGGRRAPDEPVPPP